MDIGRKSVIVVGAPGRLREGLILVLSLFPCLQVAGLAEEQRAALDLLTEKPPDLVLLDSDLPGGGALALLKELKTRRPQTRCLFLGANGKQLTVARDNGADGVLLKGFQIDDFSAAIDQLFQPGNRAGEIQPRPQPD